MTLRRHWAWTLWIAMAIGCISHGARADEDDDRIRVRRVEFPVTLSDGNTYTVVGFLEHRGELQHHALQVAVHGASYDHRYWDVPVIDRHPYSYSDFMARRGWAVLALDMLGTGESSKPNGDFLNLAETASSVHQVLQSLRHGANPVHHAFGKIALVGHSNGSVISIFTQGTYHDADGLVTTGWEHTPHPLPVDPAALAPLFANPYIVVPSEVRNALFYDLPNADPAVVAFDDAHLSDTISRGQFGDLLFTITPTPSLDHVAGVTGPVLVQLGDHDVIAPSQFAPEEASFYTSASSVTVESLRDIGHAVNTHRTNLQSWIRIDAWLRGHVDRSCEGYAER